MIPECPSCGERLDLQRGSNGGGIIFRIYLCRCGKAWESAEKVIRELQLASAAVTPIQWEELYTRWGSCCLSCRATTDLQWDHVIPRIHGGADAAHNLQRLCSKCNRAKSAKVVDYRSEEQKGWVNNLQLGEFRSGNALRQVGVLEVISLGGEGGALPSFDLVKKTEESRVLVPSKPPERARVGQDGRGTARQYDAKFELVWLGCPERRGHKWPAYRAWAKGGRLAAEVICPIYAKWRETDQWKRGFVPHLATWLNSRGWETEPGPEELAGPVSAVAPLASPDVRREAFRAQTALDARLARVRGMLGDRRAPAAGNPVTDLVRHLADQKGSG